MAERLSFQTDETPYSAMLAAEHLGRYAVAARLCEGRKVLDIACGEGYGAAFLSDRGAASVLGVDVSPAAISSARSVFFRDNVSFIEADALDVDTWNPNREKFGAIVCFETIEHVQSVDALLRLFKNLLEPNGIILISCPDDSFEAEHGVSNPFHLRVWSFSDFRKACSAVLGEANQWLIGTPLSGISILDFEAPQLSNRDASPLQICNYTSFESTLLLPAQPGHRVGETDGTFYLGIWNGNAGTLSVAAPMSRRAYLDTWYNLEHARAQLATRDAEVERLKLACTSAESRSGQLQQDLIIRDDEITSEKALRQQTEARADLLEQSLTAEDGRIARLEKEYRQGLASMEEKLASTASLLAKFELRAISIRRGSSFQIERLKENNFVLSSRLNTTEANHRATVQRLLNENAWLLKEHAESMGLQQELITRQTIYVIDLEKDLRLAATELARYQQYYQEISTSRAHRVAALYIRSAIGRNPLSKALRSSWALVRAALRALRRRFRTHFRPSL